MKRIYGLVRILPVAFAAGLLIACGSGSSSDTGNPPVTTPTTPPTAPPTTPPASGPQLVLSSATVHAQAPANQQEAVQTVQVSIQNFSAWQPVYVGGTYTTNGIDHLGISNDTGSQFQLIINFKSPSQTAPGTYQDVITVRACLETPCVNHIAGSPRTIALTYTVQPLTGPPAMTLEQNSVSWEGFVMDPQAPPRQVVNISYPNMPTGTVPFVFLSRTANAAAGASYWPSGFGSTAAGRVEIELRTPLTAGVGTFTDTVTVRACSDANCVNELAGSPATIAVHYAVSDVQSGAGYRERAIPLQANDIAWDATRQVIYVAMAADAPANANTIGVLDPVSGTFLSFAPVGSNPRRLEISPDGQYLYVGLRGASEIQRLSLPSLALDATLQLGTLHGSLPLYAREMHVSPASPRTLGVIRSTDSGQPADLVVFDDDVMRTPGVGGSFGGVSVSTFQWESGSRIFGVDSYSTSGVVSHIDAGASGLLVIASQREVVTFDQAAYLSNGRMYMQKGRVFNPLTFAQLGMFPLGLTGNAGAALALDAAQGKAFFAVTDAIQSYDLNTLAPVAAVPVLRASVNPTRATMIRWGNNGLALLNYQSGFSAAPGILLIDGAFVKP